MGIAALILRPASSTVIAQLLVCNLCAIPCLIFPVLDEVSSALRAFQYRHFFVLSNFQHEKGALVFQQNRPFSARSGFNGDAHLVNVHVPWLDSG